MSNSTTPAEILDELAQRVISSISTSPTKFDSRLTELVSHHQFLLTAFNSDRDEAIVDNFALLSSDNWLAEHETWQDVYRQIIETSIDRISEDSRYAKSVARLPIKILSTLSDANLPVSITASLLNLINIVGYRLGVWFSDRSSRTQDKRQSSNGLLLGTTNPDARAYADVVRELIGSWEMVLHFSSLSRLRKIEPTDLQIEWDAYRASWHFLWRHLRNTASLLACAVWYEDRVGSEYYVDTLKRWGRTLHFRGFELSDFAYRSEKLYPDILNVDWDGATDKATRALRNPRYPIRPKDLFFEIINECHLDVQVLVASLILSWQLRGKQDSQLAYDICADLMTLSWSDDDDENIDVEAVASRREFENRLNRISSAPGNYTQLLTEALRYFDGITEREVISGRSYTPTTTHHWSELSSACATILSCADVTSYRDSDRDFGNDRWYEDLATFPDQGDNLVWYFKRLLSDIENPSTHLQLVAEKLGNRTKHPPEFADLATSLRRSIERIEKLRDERLISAEPDRDFIKRLSSIVSERFLQEDLPVSFFSDFRLRRVETLEGLEHAQMAFTGIDKAMVIAPDFNASNFLREALPDGAHRGLTARVWRQFCRRKRIESQLEFSIDSPEFWEQITTSLQDLGPRPVLVVPKSTNLRRLLRHRYIPVPELGGVQFEDSTSTSERSSYTGRINGIDIHTSAFSAGEAWLFSSSILRTLMLHDQDGMGTVANCNYRPEDDLTGSIIVEFDFSTEWRDLPIIELHYPDEALEAASSN